MLTRVGEEQAEQLDVAARAGEANGGRDANGAAPEADVDVPQARVAADEYGMCGGVHGVVVPVLDADDRDGCAVADLDLDVRGVLRAADVVEHHGARCVRRDVDDDVPVGDAAAAFRADDDRLGQFTGDRDDECVGGLRKGDRREPVERREHRADPGITDRHYFDRCSTRPGERDRSVSLGSGEQRTQPWQRRKPPELLAAVRLGERLRVTRERALEVTAALAAAPMRVTLGRSRRVG